MHQLSIQFTGSGSEYFRIWIVNLLLILVTLSLYFPWAKARRLRYFHGNTLVGGSPLGFHGNPRQMFKGYLLIGVLFVLYSAAGQFSAVAGAIALVIVAAIAPALLRASLQFRLANTSWRGLRFSFKGSLADAYRTALPVLVPAAGIVAVLVLVFGLVAPAGWQVFLTLGSMLSFVGVLPWLFWKLKQYQHNHYAFASLQTTFTPPLRSFYLLLFKVIGSCLLLSALFLAVVFPSVYFSMDDHRPSPGSLTNSLMATIPLLLTFCIFAAIKPYVTSRLQNLVWTGTRNPSLRFVSVLRFRPLLSLTLKNWLLIILTLGLYWPFAAVALARMRLEAVTVLTRESPEDLVNHARAVEGDAAGDAAGDLFGLDIGL